MKKIILLIILGLVVFLGAFFLLDKNNSSDKEQLILQKTLEISQSYASLRFQTDNILLEAKNYNSYEEWQLEMDVILAHWLKMEQDALVLEQMANEMNDEKVGFKLINSALAYDKQEISKIFDSAPAGKKIATLAKHLGVDAKKAYAILKQDQAQVEADAWTEAGDTFKKLEATAVAIKNTCKVVTFVGTVAVTGGTAAIAAGSTLAKAAVVVAGADLSLEISDDAAKIALGDKNKISVVIGEARVVTEPLAAILMISTLPNNLSKTIDKLGAVTFGAEQLNSSAQEGKVIGIKLPTPNNSSENKTMMVSVLEKEELAEWLNNEVENFEETTQEEVDNILKTELTNELSQDGGQVEELEIVAEENNQNKQELEISQDNSHIVGIWKGILSFTQSAEADERAMDYVLEFKQDGVLGGEAAEVYSSWLLLEGNILRLILNPDEGEGYDEFLLNGNNLTFVKRAGINSEGLWQEDYADSDFFGGKFIEINLSKQ